MQYFSKNVLRTIIKNKGSYIGGILIIALGILIFVAMFNVATNMIQLSEDYYNQTNFADIFSKVNAISYTELKKLENIDGIQIADGKLSEDVRLMIENSENIVSLHIMSYDEENQSLNKFMVSDNTPKLSSDSILIGNQMFNAYKFNINDKIKVIINGKLKEFKIAGTVQNPEYIISMPPSGGMPDSRIYDIACINKSDLEKLLNKSNVVNELSFILEDGYKFSDVKYLLEEELSNYGLISLQEKKDQPSNNQLQTQIKTFNSISTTLPIMFLIVSIFMLYIILKKIIDQDRSLIGTIKAFGFNDYEIFSAYIKQGLITGILGAILGSILSIPFSMSLFSMVLTIYNLPNTGFTFYILNVAIGIVISMVTSILATYFGVKEILKINPAESMRLLSPNINTNINLPYIINKLFNSKQIMGIRAVLRNKFRSLVIALSIAFPFALITVLSSFLILQEKLTLEQYTKVQTYDLKANIYNYSNYNDIVNSIKKLDGVYSVEAIAEYSIKVKNKNISQYSNLVCLNSNSQLYKIMDINNNFYEPLEDGLIISNVLAKKLNIKEGDSIEIENTSLSVVPVKIPLIKVIDEAFNSGCYININALSKYFNINKNVNSVIFNVQKDKIKDVKNVLINAGNISSVIDKQMSISSQKDMLKSNSSIMSVFGILSVIAGIVLIYNISNISIRERKNEFGTMNILGLNYKEIYQIIIFEQIIDFIMGVIIAIPIIVLLKKLVETISSSEYFSMTLVIQSNSYVYSFVISIMIVVLSLIAILHNVKSINLTDILKER